MSRASAKQGQWEDHYTRRARREKYPARSVYKLQEIQNKHRLIKKGSRVLDLGCAPGSWLLYAAELTGPRGRVLGIDLKAVTVAVPAHVSIRTADVFELDIGGLAGGFDVVLSDMAPATTGHRSVDAARSAGLCQAALEIARRVLVPGGGFVCKIFQGPDAAHFQQAVRMQFRAQRLFKPRSSRKASSEIYVIGLGYRLKRS